MRSMSRQTPRRDSDAKTRRSTSEAVSKHAHLKRMLFGRIRPGSVPFREVNVRNEANCIQTSSTATGSQGKTRFFSEAGRPTRRIDLKQMPSGCGFPIAVHNPEGSPWAGSPGLTPAQGLQKTRDERVSRASHRRFRYRLIIDGAPAGSSPRRAKRVCAIKSPCTDRLVMSGGSLLCGRPRQENACPLFRLPDIPARF